MNENKIKELINLYFDGELAKSEEGNLFSLLASDQFARDYFKQLSLIRNTVENDTEDFPAELEEKILRSVQARKNSSEHTRIFYFVNALAYGAILVLIVMNIYLLFKTSTSQEKIESLSREIQIQAKTIEMMYNSLPVIEVKSANEKIVTIKPTL